MKVDTVAALMLNRVARQRPVDAVRRGSGFRLRLLERRLGQRPEELRALAA